MKSLSSNYNVSEFKAKIFVPGKGIDLTPTSSKLCWISSALIIICLILLTILDDPEWVLYIGANFGLLYIISSIWGYYSKQKKHGSFKGELVITDDYVSVQKVSYRWQDVDKFRFGLFEVLDEQLWPDELPYYRWYGGPAYSMGVDNFIELRINEKVQKVFFQLESPSQKVDALIVLRRQFFLDHITLQDTYDGMQLEYEEIQELKKMKSEWLVGSNSN